MNIHPMWEQFPTLKKELNQTLDLMEKNIVIKNPEVQQAVLDMIHAGGKLLRPAYQLLFSQFGKQREPKKAIALAASIEMLHTASLIHDDIVDCADTRRNLMTIQKRFGNDIAVYAGDYLFVTCFKLLAQYASSLKSVQLNAKSMEKVLAGELGQMNYRYNYSGGTKAYLENISGKTAELFAMSCFIGAYESGCALPFSNTCRKIGENIGMAFQILDDILDYSETSVEIGKPVLEDVKQGVYSLPLLFAIENKPNEILPLLDKKDQLTDYETKELYSLVQQSGGVKKAHELARQYTEQAILLIKKLPDTSQKTKEVLEEITRQILNRQN